MENNTKKTKVELVVRKFNNEYRIAQSSMKDHAFLFSIPDVEFQNGSTGEDVASLVVTACNNYDKLVKALKDVYHNYGLIEDDKKNVTIPYSVIEKIKELLKNVSVS